MNLTKDDSVQVLLHDRLALLKMPSIINLYQARDFQELFQRLLQTEPALKKVIFDFGEVKFLDSCGIGALIYSLTLAKNQGIEWLCWSCPPEIKYCLELAAIADDLKIEPGSEAVVLNHPRTKPLPIGKFPPSEANSVHPAYGSKMKRLIDIVGSLIGLGVTGLLSLPIAIAIKLEDPGPIFCRQLYRGYLGKPFHLWKFRSLTANGQNWKYDEDHEAGVNILKSKNSPRLTGVGKFLIQNNLDELPRFWSVLSGEMSLVGSYPYTCERFSRYGLEQWQSLNVKPGITGEWLLHKSFKGMNIQEMLPLDLQYQYQWGFGYDLKIIWKTITSLFDTSDK